MRAALLIAALAAGACVPKSQHLELQAELDETREALQQRVARLEQELASSVARASSLEAEKTRLQSSLAAVIDDRAALEASVAEMEQALAEMSDRQAEADARIAEFRGLLDRFKPLIDAGQLRVKIVEGRMVVELPTDILFASGSASLSTAGVEAIRGVGEILASIPDRRFQVAGHTDDVPIATAQYPSNWELASARALTVLREMIDAGVEAERISGSSYGETDPLTDNDTNEGRAANRRIEIIVVPDLSSLPGYDELSEAVADQTSP